MAESAPLLREYVAKNCIVGSNPTISARFPAWHARLVRNPQNASSAGFFFGSLLLVRCWGLTIFGGAICLRSSVDFLRLGKCLRDCVVGKLLAMKHALAR